MSITTKKPFQKGETDRTSTGQVATDSRTRRSRSAGARRSAGTLRRHVGSPQFKGQPVGAGQIGGRAAVSAAPTRVVTTVHPSAGPARTRRRSALGVFFSELGLEKLFTIASFLTALALVFLCGADLLFAWPFMQASLLFDVTYLLCGLALIGLSWSVARDPIRWPRKKVELKFMQ